jgi:hypothetical protein
MVLRAVSFDVDLDAQQNDEPAKDSRSLAPPECRSRDRDKDYPAVNRAGALFWRDQTGLFVAACIAVKVKVREIFPLNSIDISVNICTCLRLEIK